MTQNFGTEADLYDSIRPTYPAEAVRYMLGAEPLTVADVGAGTGKLTAGLLAEGHTVTAVEPDGRMLAKLRENHPGARGEEAPAEDLPFADASLDAVTAGQAFHWFDKEKALTEFRRVLKPGGVFAPVWNVRDEEYEWVAAMSEIIGWSSAEYVAPLATAGDYFAPQFPDQEYAVFRFALPVTRRGLVALVRSRSYYIDGTPERRAELDEGMERLLDTHPDLKGRERIDLPYKAYAFRLTAG
ncbi:class I SAM-dependent methyltransferase [Salininema proteolyticum]|uniref:Class I SAM-dependent methyltransferase n=1 Tax=Salininema proteolyticum TaxID=1607685 RepID=A0ABV8U4N9_9ACTN